LSFTSDSNIPKTTAKLFHQIQFKSLDQSMQQKVFSFCRNKNAGVTFNMAETSLSLNGIFYNEKLCESQPYFLETAY
jgi:hypothetical protein